MSLEKFEYYSNDLGVIYHGDCLEILPELPQVDLVLTDPPYRGDFGHGGGLMTGTRLKTQTTIIEKVGSSPDFDVTIYLPLILKSAESSLIWCSCKQLPELLGFIGDRFNLITWVKTNPVPLVNNKLLNDCEYCVCFLGKKFRYPQIPYKEKRTAYIMKNGQDIHIDHPTVKPIELIIMNLKQFSVKDNTVLDPFLGSGTTAVACCKLNRRFIGIEKEEKYCEIAAKRLEQYRTGLTPAEQDAGQGTLFV